MEFVQIYNQSIKKVCINERAIFYNTNIRSGKLYVKVIYDAAKPLLLLP
jgi:hypothetical protein